MKKLKFRKSLFLNLAFLAVGLSAFAFNLFSKKDTGNPLLLNVIKDGINAIHYSPQKLDDNFSKKLFALYLKRLDPDKKFLTQEEVNQLRKYETKLDDEITDGSYEFFNLSYTLITKDMERAKHFYPVILSQPFDFTKNETYETDGEKLNYAKDTVALKEQWRLYMKYEVLIRVSEKMDEQAKARENKDTSWHDISPATLEENARTKTKKTFDDFFQRMQDLDEDDWIAIYVNCITNLEDPHTEYFPPAEKQNFDIALTGQLEGIGAQLQQTDEYIKVTHIVPGSPSWKDGQLKAGDIILKVAQGKADPVDIVGMKMDKAVMLIRGKKGTEVRLTVKKPDGSIVVITLIRDKIILEETFAKSLLVHKDGKTYGYIRLPEFYADFNQNGSPNCSDDIKREVLKLKDEKVDGIMIDIRDNGGGSLDEVVKMAGLFIKNGPMVQVKDKSGSARDRVDTDNNIYYDGPLVIMVNENSASASEILAAALQDYHRAIILGSPTTWGKGTVQQVYDLDQMVGAQNTTGKKLGSLKITLQKFYRINGASTQLHGVTPDVVLPDFDEDLKYGEKQEDYPLPWDEISPAAYTPWTPTWNAGTVISKSKQRVATSDFFNEVNTYAMQLKSALDKTAVPLNLDQYRQEELARTSQSKKIDELKKSTTQLDIQNLMIDQPDIKKDTTRQARNEEFVRAIRKDFYVNEAASVLGDMADNNGK